MTSNVCNRQYSKTTMTWTPKMVMETEDSMRKLRMWWVNKKKTNNKCSKCRQWSTRLEKEVLSKRNYDFKGLKKNFYNDILKDHDQARQAENHYFLNSLRNTTDDRRPHY